MKRLLYLAIGVAACGCDGGCGADDAQGDVVLEDDVQVIATLEADLGKVGYFAPQIVDVVVDGDRIVAVYNNGTLVGEGWLWSEDRGATWSHHYNPGGGHYLNVPVRSLLAGGGELWAVTIGEDTGTFLLYEPVTFVGGEPSYGPFARHQSAGDVADGLETASFTTYTGSNETPPAVLAQWLHWDRPDATPTRVVTEWTGRDPECIRWGWPLAGRDARGWTVRTFCRTYPTDGPATLCVESARAPDLLMPGRTCQVDTAELIPDEADLGLDAPLLELDTAERPGFAALTYSDGGWTYAVRVTSEGIERLDVGPGTVFRPNAEGDAAIHRRAYDRFVPVVETFADDVKLMTLHGWDPWSGAFVSTGLPTRPCPDDEPCGWRPITTDQGSPGRWPPVAGDVPDRLEQVLQWAEPLGGDEYLMFYALETLPPSAGQSRIQILTSREIYAAPTGTWPPGTPAGALEIACVRESLCFYPGDWGGWPQCIERWRNSDDPDAVAAFTAATTCDELRAADPTVSPPTVCQGAAWCDRGIGYQCNELNLPVQQRDCHTYGGICTVVGSGTECLGPAGECGSTEHGCAVDGSGCVYGEYLDCPGRGGTCATGTFGIGCIVDAAGCTAADGWTCDDDVSVGCTGPGVGLALAHCDLVEGLTCDGYGGCAAVEVDCPFDPRPRCDGDDLVYCIAGSARRLDCAALGATCMEEENTDGSGHCR